jgi:O-methyltransferase involved in polyketide biosynthesis
LFIGIGAGHLTDPTKFGIRAGDCEAFLAKRGFEVKENLTAADMREKYLSTNANPDAAKIPSLFCLVYATVIGKKEICNDQEKT